MNIIHLNNSDIIGGAARAAYRLHKSLLSVGLDSQMWVNKSISGDWTVRGPDGRLAQLLSLLAPHAVKPLVKLLKTDDKVIHSPSLIPSRWIDLVNSSDADIVHLHWVQGEMLSISEIGRIRKPVVWTLHDMWAFCGAEHYTEDCRWTEGYNNLNRPANESGFDLNKWTWLRKQKYWNRPLQIVTPSKWLGNCIGRSRLMRDWPVSVIPNPVDVDRWMPIDRSLARQLLGLPPDVPFLLFGALGGCYDSRKGFDFILDALNYLKLDSKAKEIQLVVFGQNEPKFPLELGFPVHYTGHLNDDLSLRTLYSAADVIVIPSRLDNLPNIGLEAQACGTPVVAFDIGGFADIVSHKKTGYLAKAFDTEDLAKGVMWVLENSVELALRHNSRIHAEELFSYSGVAEQYKIVYQHVLDVNRSIK